MLSNQLTLSWRLFWTDYIVRMGYVEIPFDLMLNEMGEFRRNETMKY
jgi:hypothetical protein